MTQSWDTFAGDERIDSRDLIDAAAELREELAEGYLTADETPEAAEFLAAVDALADEVGSEWTYGAGLIREDTFEEYARELAEDIGAISGDERWPCTCIDWERAARELAMDYTSVTFLGHDYLVRA